MEKSHWSELMEDGETRLQINLYQYLHLRILTRTTSRIQKRRVSRSSFRGKIIWGAFEALKAAGKITSPRAMRIFWFWVDARWVLAGLEKKKLGINAYEFRFIRKKHLNPQDIKMNFQDYRAVHQIRNSI